MFSRCKRNVLQFPAAGAHRADTQYHVSGLAISFVFKDIICPNQTTAPGIAEDGVILVQSEQISDVEITVIPSNLEGLPP